MTDTQSARGQEPFRYDAVVEPGEKRRVRYEVGETYLGDPVGVPFDGLVVGSLENPVAAPGHPLCHVVKLDAGTREEIRREIDAGEFDGHRAHDDAWPDD